MCVCGVLIYHSFQDNFVLPTNSPSVRARSHHSPLGCTLQCCVDDVAFFFSIRPQVKIVRQVHSPSGRPRKHYSPLGCTPRYRVWEYVAFLITIRLQVNLVHPAHSPSVRLVRSVRSSPDELVRRLLLTIRMYTQMSGVRM